MGLVTFSAATVVAAVFTLEARAVKASKFALEVAAVLIEQARFAVLDAFTLLVVAAVLTEQARFAVLATAAVAVAAVVTELASLVVFDIAALVEAVVEAVPAKGIPRITCAEVVTDEAPATFKFLVSVAFAVGLAAPVIEPASDAPLERGAVTLAAQLTDAARDCNMPPELPFKAAALRAEPLSSIRNPAN
jgi:hypothetical protein